MKMIDYAPAHSSYMEAVMVDKITHLSKSDTGGYDYTLIHLVTGEVLVSEDSIKTLSSRINSL